MAEENQSGVNTVLIVILLLIVVGLAVWFLSGTQADEQENGTRIEVQLPDGEGSSTE